MTGAEVLALAFKKILEGQDIPKPESAMRVKREQVGIVPVGHKYSVNQNLAHAVLWQDFWLAKLNGGRKKSGMKEWQDNLRVPDDEEYENLRSRFLAGLLDAQDRCLSVPLRHKCDSEEEALETLTDIAIHASYHLGQLNLIRQALRKA